MDLRDLHTQTFIGRDLNLNLEVTCTGSELQELWERLLPLLADRSVTVADGVVRASGAVLPVSTAHADALRAYFEQASAFDPAQREKCYLLRLALDPAIRRWDTEYVILAGGYRPVEISPRFREIRVRGDSPQREIERVPLPDIRDALQRHAHFILLAPPGAGKTTVLQRLALDEAHARLHAPETARLPLVVRLAEQKADEDPHTFLTRLWQRELPGPGADPAAEFAAALHQGRLCLLCDALNEARRDRLQERIDDWRDFAAALPAGNRLVFTCRTDDYDGRLKVQQVEIDPLDDGQIRQFAAACLHHTQPDAFWSALTGPHADLLPLARTPYYLALLVDEFDAHEELPTQRAQLFERFATKLLSREEDKRHPDWIDLAAQELALRELAFAMQSLGEGTEVDEAFALAQIPAQVRFPSGRAIPTPGEAVLRLGAAATLLARTTDSVKFTHHLLQEYFAAEALLRRWRDGEDLDDLWRVRSGEREMSDAPRGEWDPLPGPPTTRWEQTTALAATLCPELVDSVQPINPALAARCLVEQGPAADPARIGTSRRALQERLDSPAVHLRSRIEAGLLLGRLGDPRFAEESVRGVRVILPPLVEISAAQAQIGTGRWEQGDNDERPRHKVTLAAYTLGRYPVTNAEFRCFLEADGYDPAGAWWTEGGRYWLRGETPPGETDPVDDWMKFWQRLRANPREIDEQIKRGWMTVRDAGIWRRRITRSEEEVRGIFESWYPRGAPKPEPRYWDDERFNSPSQPVVGVTWYEAAAYANWLAALTGLSFRLPTEAEWEWAARRGGRTFPWGRNWDTKRLNSLEGRVMATTPVGVYPQGATPDRIHDLAGNVWEWTATLAANYPSVTDGSRENPDAPGLRIARGGGWAANRWMVRCAYRGRNPPGLRYDALGSRLARNLS